MTYMKNRIFLRYQTMGSIGLLLLTGALLAGCARDTTTLNRCLYGGLLLDVLTPRSVPRQVPQPSQRTVSPLPSNPLMR